MNYCEGSWKIFSDLFIYLFLSCTQNEKDKKCYVNNFFNKKEKREERWKIFYYLFDVQKYRKKNKK